MKKIILCVMMVLPLGACVHWQDFNPFHKDAPPAVETAAPVEKIGPDVIAVPVEPVEQEDMLATPADTTSVSNGF